jgi:hypothetical protein
VIRLKDKYLIVLVLQDALFSRMRCSPGCIVLQDALFSRMHCSPGCIVLQDALFSRMHCSPGCIVLQDALFSRMHCSPGCNVLHMFSSGTVLCSSECDAPQSTSQQGEEDRHRVGRVLSFFSSRRNWDSPPPSTSDECATPL